MGRKVRTEVDFSKHEHRVEIFKSKEDNEIRIDHFQVGSSSMGYIQFINTVRTLTVTGDYGNWVFNRPFHPSEEGFVSDFYWIEKLKMYSEQNFMKLDSNGLVKDLEELIETGLEDYGYKEEKLEEAKEWFGELLEATEDSVEYLYKAYRDPYKPSFIDYDEIPLYYEIPPKLNIIFDAFDEICKRLAPKKEVYELIPVSSRNGIQMFRYG